MMSTETPERPAQSHRPWFADLEDAEQRGAHGSADVGYFDCSCEICRHRYHGRPF